MPDWDYITGMAEEYGMGDPDMDVHDPVGHCGKSSANPIENNSRQIKSVTCKNCGAKGLTWKQHSSGKYWLFDETDWHDCNQPVDIKMESFESELCRLINKYSMDAKLNTPDFILTQYIMKHLVALEELNASVNFHYNGDNSNEESCSVPFHI